MVFTPHILQRKSVSHPVTDEYGRVIASATNATWETICRCRCDHNTTQEFTNINGSVYRPNYHIVCDAKLALQEGDIVRCMEGENVICEGEVYRVKRYNYYYATEIWL